jgi:hypothetical protein
MTRRLLILALLCAGAAGAQIDGDPLYANLTDTNGASFYHAQGIQGRDLRPVSVFRIFQRFFTGG